MKFVDMKFTKEELKKRDKDKQAQYQDGQNAGPGE